MKVGGESKRKTVSAIVLLVIALALFVRMFVMRQGSSGAPALPANVGAGTATTPTGNSPRAAREDRTRHIAYKLEPSLDPRLHLELLKDSEDVKYTGSGRNIFREHLEDIPPQRQGGLINPGPNTPPRPLTPPPPPPINVKFFGWANRTGEAKAIFLSQGDDVFVAHEGDIIARRYKVVRISPNAVEIQDVLSNNTQTIPLTQG